MAAARTSESDPLRIAPVCIRYGGGVIGLTFCPGKKGKGQYSGVWNRDLRADLLAIQAFGAKILVTLMESEELDELNVPAKLLCSSAKEFGLEWHHLPIKDVDVPDDDFEDLWTYSGFRLRNALARGEKIVVHCRGGLGRTGTVAGRLLVEFGDEPETAINKIRTARQGCVETAAQEKYVEKCRPIAFARVQRSPEERVLASLLGGAIGDALGYEVEFKSLREIRERFGDTGIRTPVLSQGKLVVSDDTQMTLFTLEGLLLSFKDSGADKDTGIVSSIRQEYLDWLKTQSATSHSRGKRTGRWLAQQAVMHARRAPGNTCLSALESGGHGTIGEPINNSKGCGGAMRVAPIGWIGPGVDAHTVFQLAANVAALTHGHPSGYLSAGMVAAMMYLLIDGVSLARHGSYHKRGAIEQSCDILRTFAGHEETLAAVNRAVALAAGDCDDRARALETLGGGWVGEESLAIAIYAVLSAGSFVEAVSIGANHSGDSDSTASIAGQLWGAMNGLGGIPHDWVINLDVLPPMLHLARQLIQELRETRGITLEGYLKSRGRGGDGEVDFLQTDRPDLGDHLSSNEKAPSGPSTKSADDHFAYLMEEARISAAWEEFHRGYVCFRSAFNALPEDASTSVRAEILEGLENMQSGRLQIESELPSIEAAVEADPENAEKRFHLALALSKLGRDTQSVAEYLAVLNNPEGLCENCFRDLWNNIGWFYFRQRNFREALKWFEQTYQVALSDEVFAAGACALAIENKILCFSALDMAADAESAATEYVRRYGRLPWAERRALERCGIDADGIYVAYRAARGE